MDILVNDLAKGKPEDSCKEPVVKKSQSKSFAGVLGELKPKNDSNEEPKEDQEIIVQPSKLNIKMRQLLRGKTISSAETPKKEVRHINFPGQYKSSWIYSEYRTDPAHSSNQSTQMEEQLCGSKNAWIQGTC